ncbi:unnamed protein product [Mytilus edulis]|uniref:Ig-like domain-containing protein n=1 Tax=Mytilus edulis TaxID=6550 RepID=A0A8S3RBT8_MYTED|nr:unnamed protein product [Mytilus edulis]
MNQNTTGLLGSNNTHLTCSFFLEKDEQILSVQFNAKNITEDFDDGYIIATFKPEKAARTYLSDRVTLTNMTNTSTNATLTFNELKFTDEKDYKCKIFYYDKVKDFKLRESEATRISVKVQVRDVHIKNEPNHKQYDQKTDNITLTCKANGNPEPSYKWFKENSNRIILSTNDLYIIEDVIRNNSGVYICQAYNTIDNIIYSHSTSVEIDIVDELLPQSESVSSKISAGIFNTITWLKLSEYWILKQQVQTRHVNVNKQPKKQYDRKTDQINLTCSAIGNPEPEYIWFKQDNRRNILSRINTYTIRDVNPNNSGIYICEAFNIINHVIYRNSYSVAIDIVHAAYAISFTCTVVVVVLCFAIRKNYFNREKRNIHSEVSDDQEQISVDNEYEEIESVSYHEVILHTDRIETSNPPITEEEISLESVPISTCTNSSESYTTSSYLYVNTDIFNTNGNRKVSANHETISDHPNGLGNCQIGVDNTFVKENSGSDTLHFNQYVNTTSLRVPNFYEDLNHSTVDIHRYESPHKEEVTTFTE